MVYCWWRIVQKAGFGNWGLLAIVPPLPFILIIVLTFAKWHIPEEEPEEEEQ
jgi:hypothetical protein